MEKFTDDVLHCIQFKIHKSSSGFFTASINGAIVLFVAEQLRSDAELQRAIRTAECGHEEGRSASEV